MPPADSSILPPVIPALPHPDKTIEDIKPIAHNFFAIFLFILIYSFCINLRPCIPIKINNKLTNVKSKSQSNSLQITSHEFDKS